MAFTPLHRQDGGVFSKKFNPGTFLLEIQCLFQFEYSFVDIDVLFFDEFGPPARPWLTNFEGL